MRRVAFPYGFEFPVHAFGVGEVSGHVFCNLSRLHGDESDLVRFLLGLLSLSYYAPCSFSGLYVPYAVWVNVGRHLHLVTY